MNKKILNERIINDFRLYLINEEKSQVTISKYIQDVMSFYYYAASNAISKETVLSYKNLLISKYAARSVNSKLASLNSLFVYLGWIDLKVKSLKIQREIYVSEEKELTKNEYVRLLRATEQNTRLKLVIETICGTGIRVSELKYFTVEGVKKGTVVVRCKSKTRNIILPNKLKRLLLQYAKKNKISKGAIFITKNGKPLDRSNIWSDMKKLCKKANVNPKKVFPHNLRKLFARTFYGIEKDIAKLADILGHSNIDTTRIYIISTGFEHRKKIEKLGLVV